MAASESSIHSPVCSSQIQRPMATSRAKSATTRAMMAIRKLPELPGGPTGPCGPASPDGPATPWPYLSDLYSLAGLALPWVLQVLEDPGRPRSRWDPDRRVFQCRQGGPLDLGMPAAPGMPVAPGGPWGPRITVGAEAAVGRGVLTGLRVLVGRGVLVGLALALRVKFLVSPPDAQVNDCAASNPLTRNEIDLPAWEVPVSEGGIKRKKVPLAFVLDLSTSLPSINAWTSVPLGATVPSTYAGPKIV